MLELRGLRSGYGWLEVVRGVSLRVPEGEVVMVVGSNGAGKTTLLKTIVGHIRPTAGQIILDGVDISGWSPHKISALGVRYVPQDRGVFTRLTVEENLKIAESLNEEMLREAIGLFPELRPLMPRRAGELSGGEQQILAVARALASKPRLLVMDEPATGLMPPLVRRMIEAIERLKEEGVSALIVEQNPRLILELADELALMESGEIRWIARRERLSESQPLLRKALGLTFLHDEK